MFDKAFNDLMVLEGSYSNNPTDPGAETYRGISRRFNPQWRGWLIIDNYKKQYGTDPSILNAILNKDQNLQAAVGEFYKSQYWDKMRLDDVANLSYAIAYQLFQCGIQGAGTAVKMLQRALNCMRDGLVIKVDGLFGEKTLHQLDIIYSNKIGNYSNILPMIKAQQIMHYMEIVEYYPNQMIYLNGWLNRVGL